MLGCADRAADRDCLGYDRAPEKHEAAGCFRAVAASTAPFKPDPWHRDAKRCGVSPNRPSAAVLNVPERRADAMACRAGLSFSQPFVDFQQQ